MTQQQFEIICKIIENGAPALANELCSALNNLVIDRNNLAKQLEEIQKSAERGEENSDK